MASLIGHTSVEGLATDEVDAMARLLATQGSGISWEDDPYTYLERAESGVRGLYVQMQNISETDVENLRDLRMIMVRLFNDMRDANEYSLNATERRESRIKWEAAWNNIVHEYLPRLDAALTHALVKTVIPAIAFVRDVLVGEFLDGGPAMQHMLDMFSTYDERETLITHIVDKQLAEIQQRVHDISIAYNNLRTLLLGQREYVQRYGFRRNRGDHTMLPPAIAATSSHAHNPGRASGRTLGSRWHNLKADLRTSLWKSIIPADKLQQTIGGSAVWDRNNRLHHLSGLTLSKYLRHGVRPPPQET